jgi:catalase (peroxidase I)
MWRAGATKILSKAIVATAFSGTIAFSDGVDIDAMRDLIKNIYDEDKSRGPLFVRLSTHASGTYDRKTQTGGSPGATMRFEPEAAHKANAGLKFARDLLEPVKTAYPDVSYSNFNKSPIAAT